MGAGFVWMDPSRCVNELIGREEERGGGHNLGENVDGSLHRDASTNSGP